MSKTGQNMTNVKTVFIYSFTLSFNLVIQLFEESFSRNLLLNSMSKQMYRHHERRCFKTINAMIDETGKLYSAFKSALKQFQSLA